MTIDLHSDCKERLLKVLHEALPGIEARNGMFIERKSAAPVVICDFVLPKTGKVHDRLLDYIDDFPFTEFVIDTLGMELWELDKYQSEKPSVRLAEIEGYENSKSVAERLIESFQTLPWSYQLSFLLPEQLSSLLPSTKDEVVISPTIRVARATDQFAAQFPLATPHEKRQQRVRGGSGLLSLLATDPPAYIPGSLFLQIKTEGFIGQYGGSSPAVRAERTVRAFCGLGIALRLFKHTHKLQGGQKSYFYVHRQNEDGTWSPDNRIDVEDTTDRGLSGIELHDLEGRIEGEDQKLLMG